MNTLKGTSGLFLLLALLLLLAGCGGGGSTEAAPGPVVPAYGPDLAMTLPDTLTGGSGPGGLLATLPGGLAPMARGSQGGAIQPMAGGGGPCNFLGHGNGDPFKNGHSMTKFLVAAVASWTCIADNVIGFIDLLVFLGVPIDGTPLDLVDASHQTGDPTWLSVNELSPTQTEVKLYWTADHVAPVAVDEGFYLFWDTTGGTAVGKLVVDVSKIADDPPGSYDPINDPAFLRLDFNYTATSKTGDLFLGFNPVNLWVQGWRIQVVKQLDATTPKYTAKGTIQMKTQWDPNYTFGDIPQLNSFAVADTVGTGAAIAQMFNIGLVLFPVDIDDDHLGEFLFTKDDRYYFGGGPQVIFKDVTLAAYMGSQAITAGGGGFINTAADVDALIDFTMAANGDPVPYAGTEYQGCVAAGPLPDADCRTFLNALFSGGDFGAEANTVAQQPPPGDSRRDALDGSIGNEFANACPAEAGGCIWGAGVGEVFEMIP